MKLYTSYWAQVRFFPTNLVGLNTTVWPPKWRPLGQDKRGVWVIDCPMLKPGEECDGLCRGSCDPKHPQDCEFLKVYSKQLDKIDFNKFINSLQNLHDKICEGEHLPDLDFALIVFETATNKCSERWSLQDWVRKNGIEINEWHK